MRLLTALALLFSVGAAAQTPPPRPCSAAEYGQFDFWLGEWSVTTPDGKHAGENSITRAHGCVLREEWRGAGGFTGSSLNIYDAATRRWHQTWVDNSGTLLLLDGRFEDGAMRMTGSSPGSDGKPVQQRITWTPLDEKTVRQLWEQSADGGRTWTVAFDGKYRKR